MPSCSLAAALLWIAPAVASARATTAPAVCLESVEELAVQLKDSNEETRRRSVEALARLATPAAWNLVIEALVDPAAAVADEAQVRLGEVTDAGVIETLSGKAGLGSKDAWVRLRAAEALGRVGVEVDGVPIAKVLSDRDTDIRRTAAWTLERLADANRLERNSRRFVKQALDQTFKKDQSADVRAAALYARHALEPLTVSDLFEGLAKKDEGVVRAATTHLLGRVQMNQLVGLFSDTLEDEEVCARRALAEEFARDGSASAAVSLTSMLQREFNLRMRWTILEFLQDLSGAKEARDGLAWREWALRLEPGWKAPKPESRTGGHEYDSEIHLFGQQILSDHLAVLIDMSGALGMKREGDVASRGKVEAELRTMLASLPEKSQFNLIPYATVPTPFEKQLVPVTTASTKRALKFLADSKATGERNVWEALMIALSDGRVDTIVILTDGPPAGARRRNGTLIAQLIGERNRFRKVTLDVLLFGSTPELEAQWKPICAESGGRLLVP